MNQISIYGAGGFAREVAWLIESCNQDQKQYTTTCFIDDNHDIHGKIINGIPVLGLEEAHAAFPNAKVVSGVGSPQTRQLLMIKAAKAGFAFETIIHPDVKHSSFIQFGKGTVICAGNILTTNILLGNHVQINLDCTVGHDVIMGDYTTLAPGVHVSGWVHFGKRAYVGTGAVIINGSKNKPLVIGNDAVIGAGACVVKSVPPNITVVGIPAKQIGH